MKGLTRLSSVFIVMTFFAVNAWADKPKVLLLKDLKSGTEAIGFSVFKGVEPQPFDVVLGEPIDQAGNSFILVRISGGPMETPLEKIGAISGMSGSPIFVGCINKTLSAKEQYDYCVSRAPLAGNDVFLAGALSYSIGYFFEGGPNALITPAEYMLGARFGGYAAVLDFSDRLPNKISVNGKWFTNLMLFSKTKDLPIVANPAGRCEESVKSDIGPGSMVSVFFATGAINIGGSGTVTWRDDNNIYIFGHPLENSGMVDYPFVQISVADTLQTPLSAQKLPGCYLDTQGAMTVDGAFEMAGVIGKKAAMLPYQVEVHIGKGVGTMYEEIAASSWVPLIIKSLPVVWAEQWLGDTSQLSLAYQIRTIITDQPEIFVRNFIPAQTHKNPFGEVFVRIYDPLQQLKESGFDYKVESIRVHLDVVKDFELWTAKRSFLSQEKASPGETVYANIVLEEFFNGTVKQISIPIKVPEDFMERTKSGTPSNITVLIQGGSKFTDKRSSVEVSSVEDLIKQLNQTMNYKTNILYVQQIMPRSKAGEDTDSANAKTSVKPAWKWTDIGEGDLKQFPSNENFEVILTSSPALNGFIDLDLKFNLQVEAKKDAVSKDGKETKKKKWLWLF